MLGQDHLEQILRLELKKLSCEVEWGTKLLSFKQDKNSVCAQISLPGDAMTEMATFDYVIGADGARGVVRKELGLTFIGETSNADNLMIGDIMVEGLDPNVSYAFTYLPYAVDSQFYGGLAHVG
jgi:2-polyprenyl-6-methoxyphenol hydroxylase-like FAD-dependent oxidoreductase